MLIVIDLFKSPSITSNKLFLGNVFISFISSSHVFVCFSNKTGGLWVTPPPLPSPFHLWFQSLHPLLSLSPNNAWRRVSLVQQHKLTQTPLGSSPDPHLPQHPLPAHAAAARLLCRKNDACPKTTDRTFFFFPNRNYIPRTPPSTPNLFVFSIPVHEGLGLCRVPEQYNVSLCLHPI